MTASANRAAMPTIAALVDAAREAFGADQVTVVYAAEDGVELGRLVDFGGVVPVLSPRECDKQPAVRVPSWKRGRK